MEIRQKNRNKVADTLSRNLRAARARLGMTQAQVAEAIDASVEFYSRCERSTVLPSVPLLMDIANALHVGIDELLGTTPESMAQPAQFADLPADRAEIGRAVMAMPPRERYAMGKLLLYCNNRYANDSDEQPADAAELLARLADELLSDDLSDDLASHDLSTADPVDTERADAENATPPGTETDAD